MSDSPVERAASLSRDMAQTETGTRERQVREHPELRSKAFSELEHQGLVVRRQGIGTFVAAAPSLASVPAAPKLLGSLAGWVDRARQDGLSPEQIRILLEIALDEPAASQDDRRAAAGVA